MTLTIPRLGDFSRFSPRPWRFGGGGLGAGQGGDGSTDGATLFLMRGTSTVFDIAAGRTDTFTPAIGNNDCYYHNDAPYANLSAQYYGDLWTVFFEQVPAN